MENLFENSCFHSEEWAKETSRYLFFCRPKAIFFIIVFTLYFVLGIINLPLFGSFNMVLILSSVWYFLFIIISYRRNCTLIIEREIELNGKQLEVFTEVTNDNIKCTQSNGFKYTLYYDSIKKVAQTKNYILLMTKANLLYTLQKDSFSVGTTDGFLDFLRDKGFTVR